jgi:hypothetical protein
MFPLTTAPIFIAAASSVVFPAERAPAVVKPGSLDINVLMVVAVVGDRDQTVRRGRDGRLFAAAQWLEAQSLDRAGRRLASCSIWRRPTC